MQMSDATHLASPHIRYCRTTFALFNFHRNVSAPIESQLPANPSPPLVSPLVSNAKTLTSLKPATSHHPRVTRELVSIQALLGIGAYFSLGVPYMRRTHGLDRLHTSQRYLFF